MSGWRKKLFRVLKFIFGPLGRHFFQTSVTFRDLRILVHSYLYKEQIIYKRKKFFKICGLIRKSWKTFLPAYLCLIYYSVGYKQAQEFFEICGLIRKSRKTPRKTPGVEFIIQFLEEKLKKSLPNFFCGFVIPIKIHFANKMATNGQSSPQLWRQHFTSAHMRLPLPTRWSLQKPKYK